jgi:opacity protein-like surface antigen
MLRIHVLAAALTIGACCASAALADDDTAGLYAGGSVGVSDVRSQGYANVDYYGFDETHAAWKLFGGIRPIQTLGLELDYINFGHPATGANYSYAGANVESQAAALFAMGYLPVPLPFLDVFGKAGVSRLYQDTTAYYPISCEAGHQCAQYSGVYHQDNWQTAFAYGGGVQAKFGSVAVRAEYERISGDAGEPDIYSLGASWSF